MESERWSKEKLPLPWVDTVEGAGLAKGGLDASYSLVIRERDSRGQKMPCDVFKLTFMQKYPDGKVKRGSSYNSKAKAVVWLTVTELNKWEFEWEEKTGFCRSCYGNGEECVGGCVDRGDLYCRCRTCGGTGKPSVRVEAANG